MTRCFIIDDEKHAIDALFDLAKEFPSLEIIGYDTNPITGLETVNKLLPDLLFLDIEMPRLTGTQLRDLLNPKIKVIYVTGHPQFALRAFETSIFDYLLKPVSYKRFYDFTERLKTPLEIKKDYKENLTPEEFIFVRCDSKGKLAKIELISINYIESDNNYSLIVCKAGNYKVYITLKEFEKSLPKNIFSRIHKRFIVNFSKIEIIDGNRIFLLDKTVLQLGITYRENFLKTINNYMLDLNKNLA